MNFERLKNGFHLTEEIESNRESRHNYYAAYANSVV